MKYDYLHQIGNVNSFKTYEKLISILRLGCISSRKELENNGIKNDYDSSTFKLEVPKGKEWMYYSVDIHFDRVSLSNANNEFIRTAIELRDHANFSCFDYNNIGIVFSSQIDPILIDKDETKGLALGEVQVKEKLDLKFATGLVVPYELEELENATTYTIVDTLSLLCINAGYNLPIINYD